METMKKLTDMTEPDHRSIGFAVANFSQGTSRSITLVDFYKDAENIEISKAAPEGVRSYMEATKTLFAYGWFYYPFFTLSAFMATTAVEMALKLRLQSRPDDPSKLKSLFDQAIRDGLLRDEGFPSWGAFQADSAEVPGDGVKSAQSSTRKAGPSYTESVAQLLRHFRNTFAHPRDHWIMLPGQSIEFLILAAGIINQLWP
jgi:hypothetical protein